MGINWEPGYTLEESKYEIIRQALQHHGGNRTHAAKALGISIRTIRNYLKDMGVIPIQEVFRWQGPIKPPKEPPKPCTVEDCGKMGKFQGMCRNHYVTNVYRHRPEVKDAMRKRYRTLRGRYTLARSSAKHRDLEWSIPLREFAAFSSLPCHYCQTQPPEEMTGSWLDRRDNTQGYTLDNVVPCCGKCNRLKNDILSEKEMMAVSMVLAKLKEPA